MEPPKPHQRNLLAFGSGGIIGTLGGLIGLGGAEFRLPLLIGIFAFGPLEAVILNKAMSLVVVATALPFRARSQRMMSPLGFSGLESLKSAFQVLPSGGGGR